MDRAEDAVEPSEVFAFIAQELPTRVQQLPPRERAAFAAACATNVLRWRPPDEVALVERTTAAAWQAAEGPPATEASSLMEQLEGLGEELDDDATAASHYALRAALQADPRDAIWAAQRCFDAAFAQAEADLVVGSVVTKADHERCALSAIVQEEYQRQTRHLTLLERQGLTPDVIKALQRP